VQDAEAVSESGARELYVWERVGVAGGCLGRYRGNWAGWQFGVYRGG